MSKNKNVLLEELIKEGNSVTFKFSCSENMKKYFNEYHLTLDYDVDIESLNDSILTIPFLANLLPLSWLTDCIIWVRDIDRTFYDSIPRLKYAYQEMYPDFKFKGTVVPAKTTYNCYEIEREAIQLFSGGVDANATYIRIKELTPILVNIFSKSISSNDEKAFKADKKRIESFSSENFNPVEFVKTNFMTYVNSIEIDQEFAKKLGDTWWHGLQHSIGFISIAIPLAVFYKVRNIYIASSMHYGYRAKCASDPTTDIQFRFASFGGVIHDGFELTRQMKIKVLCNYQKETNKDYPIHVCSFNELNCCNCAKCFRTIISIVAEGGDCSKFGFNNIGSWSDYTKNMELKYMRFIPANQEKVKYWEESILRMKDNYNNIDDKKFVDWLINTDLIKLNKKLIFDYRCKNLIHIIIRKIADKRKRR